jgi:rhomboid protease GluP
MCPNCRAFISTSDRVCPYCDIQLGPKAIELRAASLGEGMPSPHSTSIIILTINFALYIAMTVATMKGETGQVFSIPSEVLRDYGAKYGRSIVLQGEWWRLITAGFLHASILHILMNSWVLFDLIAEVEQFYGTSRLLVAYVFSTFTGFLLSLWFSPLSVGASAACFGLIGIMLAIGLRRDNPMAQAIRSYYRRWLVYALVFSFLPGIDLAAHVGGLVGGFLVGLIAGLPGRADTFRERFWQGVAAVAVGLVVVSFYFDFRHLMHS